jgi:hypothetical protein
MASYATTSPQTNSDGFGTTGVASLTGFGDESIGTTTSYDMPSYVGLGDTHTQSIGEMNPEGIGYSPRASIERNASPGGLEQPVASRPSYDRDGLHVGIQEPIAAYIPSAYFRSVKGTVVNEKGEPIEKARWLVAQDGLPTAAPVENSQFAIYLLRSAYQDFVLIAESEEPGVDYVWYQYVETVVDTGDNDVQLVFEEKKPTSGLNGDIGVHLG